MPFPRHSYVRVTSHKMYQPGRYINVCVSMSRKIIESTPFDSCVSPRAPPRLDSEMWFTCQFSCLLPSRNPLTTPSHQVIHVCCGRHKRGKQAVKTPPGKNRWSINVLWSLVALFVSVFLFLHAILYYKLFMAVGWTGDSGRGLQVGQFIFCLRCPVYTILRHI